MQDKAYVLWNRGVGRAGILAVDYFVKIFWIIDVGGFHWCSLRVIVVFDRAS